MLLPFEIDGKVEEISCVELCARLWPLGKWTVVFQHVTNGVTYTEKSTSKVVATEAYHILKSGGFMPAIGIKKVGGLFHGTRYKPRTGKTETL